MGANYCTFFPDKLRLEIGKLSIAYDISFFCALHDELYECGELTRKEADLYFLACLIRKFPEYKLLWVGVYKTVRQVGWIFWYWHRLKGVIKWKMNMVLRVVGGR